LFITTRCTETLTRAKKSQAKQIEPQVDKLSVLHFASTEHAVSAGSEHEALLHPPQLFTIHGIGKELALG
jgi:hypothetical protein